MDALSYLSASPGKQKQVVVPKLRPPAKRKTKADWAMFLEEISDNYDQAERITLVMDNFGTHGPGALYETFAPPAAKALWDRFEFIYTPKHGSGSTWPKSN